MVRPVLRWMLLLVLIGTTAGGAYLYHLYGQCDELLRQTLITKLGEMAPGWDVEIGRCRFNLRGEIVIDEFKLRAGEDRSPLVDVPQAIVVIDRDRFVEKQTVVQQVRLYRPQVWLTRDRAGEWNFQKLPPRPRSYSQVAEFQIEQAMVSVRLDDPQGGEPATLVVQNADAELVPSGKRRLLVKARGGVELAVSFSAEGEWDLDAARWGGTLRVDQLKVGADLQDLAIAASPAVRRGLDKLDLLTREVLEERRQSLAEDEVIPVSAERILPARGLGLAALADVTMTAESSPQIGMDWNAKIRLREGELSNTLAPFVLYQLSGEIEATAGKLVLRNLAAQNGSTSLSVNGVVATSMDAPRANLAVVVRDLPAEPRVRECLTGGLARIYDSLQPAGRCDLALRLVKRPEHPLQYTGTVAVRNAQIAHTSFPLRTEDVNGTIVIEDRAMRFTFTGRASRRLLTMTGKVTNPGPECSAVFEIRGNGVPIDRSFRSACTPKVQEVIDHLALQGEFDGVVTLIRPAGPAQPYRPYIAARLKNCVVQPRSFPYAVTGISAKLEGSGQKWIVSELVGRHDLAVISGRGETFPLEDGRCEVALRLNAQGAPLDAQLQSAMGERWQWLWKEFSPAGRANVAARVRWIEQEPPDIAIDDATFIDSAMVLRSFPYPLENIQARMSLVDGRLTLKSFSGQHADMRIALTGWGNFTRPDEWRMRLKDIVVDDLTPDRRFRKALPEQIRQVVETLDPRQSKLSLSGMIELAGTGRPNDPVTSAWDLEFVHSGTKVTTGVDLDDLFGIVRLRGTWDGQEVEAAGEVDFNSLVFRGHQVTKVRGPFSVNGTQLVIGSKDAVNFNPSIDGRAPVQNSDRITAEFIGGTLALDGVVKLNEQTDYRVKMSLAGGRLEKYVELYAGGQHKVRGIMNGSLDLSGKGNSARALAGRGRLLISPAELYELPILVAVFNILKFAPSDKTAFRTAGFEFRVENAKFLFDRIQLIGDSISLVGRGVVGFDETVSIDFYSRGGQARVPLLGLITATVDELTKGIISVHVRGTVAKPQAVIQAMPQMTEPLRGLLSIIAGPGPAMRR